MSHEVSRTEQDIKAVALIGFGAALNWIVEHPIVDNLIAPAFIIFGVFRLLVPHRSSTPHAA
jgi:hypothetical protein